MKLDEYQIRDYQRTILRLKLEKFIFMNLYMDYYPQISENVVVYGAGQLGKLLVRCFEKKPRAFIDAKKDISNILDIPVRCIDDVEYEFFGKDCTVIVTPAWDFQTIRKRIIFINDKVNVMSLEDMVEGL